MAITRGLRDNTLPVALVRSWLRGLGIPFSEGLAPPTDLVVGEPAQSVHVTTGKGDKRERLDDPPGLNLNGATIYRGSYEEAIDEFQLLLRRLGIEERLVPFKRGTPTQGDGQPLKGRVKRKRDGEDLILFRHDKLRRAPNPTSEQMATYENVVGMAAKVYWRRNRWMLEKMHMEFEELLSYAWVWATIYMAHYELPNPSGDENQRLMHSFLQQQFHELRRYQRRRHEDLFVERAFASHGGVEWRDPNGGQGRHQLFKADLERAFGFPSASGFRRGSGGGNGVMWDAQLATDEVITRMDFRETLNKQLIKEGMAMSVGLDVTNPADYFSEREIEREVNRAYFEERLGALSHEQLVQRLDAAARATVALDFTTRRAAKFYLQEHRRSCLDCRRATREEAEASQHPD